MIYNPNIDEQVNIEDLSIFVDLEVELKSRNYLTNSENTGKIFGISYSSDENKTSFYSGTKTNGKNHITDFTDLTTYDELENHMNEGVCIETIDIDYKSWYTPLIKIRFVDVKGTGIFMEMQQNAEKNVTNSQNFFSSFFTMPYPVFTLSVKGYYGIPSELKLYCTDVRSEYDNNKGNFILETTFIGYNYAFLSDFENQYITIAPYSELDGENYWKSRNFQFKNEDGSSTPIKPLYDLYSDIKKFENEVGTKLKNDKEIQEIEKQKKDKDYVVSLIAKINNISNNNESGLSYENIESFFITKSNTHIVYIPKSNKDDKLFKYFNDIYLEAKNITSLGSYNVIEPKRISKIVFKNNKVDEYSEYISFLRQNGLGDYKIQFGDKGLSDIVNNDIIYLNDPTNEYNKLSIINISSLVNTLNDYNDYVNSKTQENIKIFKNKISFLTKKSLNFTPSINNFLRLISAHIETFAHIVETCVLSIDSNRKLSEYGLSPDSTDNKLSDNKFYPFSSLNKIEDNTLKETWPNEFTLNGRTINETELIYALTKAQTDSLKKSLSIDNAFKPDNFIPLNVYDFINNKNPYINIMNENLNDILVNIYIRMFYTVGLNKMENLNDKNKYIELTSKIDGFNLYNVFKYGKNNDLIKNLTPEKIIELMSDIKINNTNIIKESGGNNTINIIKNTYNNTSVDFIPLDIISMEKMNNILIDTINSKKTIFFDEVSFSPTSYIDGNYNSFFNYNNPSNDNSKTIFILNEKECKDYIENTNTLFNEMFGEKPTILFNDYKIKEDSSCLMLSKKDLKTDGYITPRITKQRNYETSLSTFLGDGGTTNFRKDTSFLLKDIESNYNNEKKNSFELIKKDISELHYPIFRVDEDSSGTILKLGRQTCSVFGTKLYNQQTSLYQRAFLFLHSLPMNIDEIYKIFDNIEKQNIVNIPKSTMLFIGSLLYRNKEKTTDILNTNGYILPESHKYIFNSTLKKNVMYIPSTQNERLTKIKSELFDLNENIQSVFINSFKEWVVTEFERVDTYCKIDKREEIFDLIKNKADISLIKNKFKTKVYQDVFNIYVNVSLGSETTKSLFIENNISSPAVEESLKILKEKISICSIGLDIYNFSKNKINSELVVSKQEILLYLNNFLKTFKNNSEESQKTLNETEKSLKSDIIYMSKYNYIKSLYDKWFGGLAPNSFVDFYSRFDVMDRSYNTEIGDKLIIDFSKTLEKLVNGTGGSKVINTISTVLSENNFSFIPLTGVKFYKEKNDLSKLFEPVSYMDIKDKSDETSFMCVYTGKPSSFANVSYNNLYKQNGFEICNSDDMSESITLPYDFSYVKPKTNKFLKVPSFLVSIGNQYESHFTKISVNMNSPATTDDSINSVYNLSRLSPGKKVSVGQNLYNVYSNRSFNCEIEMIGNAQIQPYMYFQLTNIPMWNGTYLILGVSHSISAGSFKTKINGVKMSYAYPYINEDIYDSPVDIGIESIENGINIIDTFNDKDLSTFDKRYIGNPDNFIYGDYPNNYPYNLVYKGYNIYKFLHRMNPSRYEKNVPEEIIKKIKVLIDNVILPIEKSVGKIFTINSCYRSDSNGSQHQKGEAVDIGFTSDKYINSQKLYNHIRTTMKNNGFKYDQLIFEYRTNQSSAWVHISFRENEINRMEDFDINIG